MRLATLFFVLVALRCCEATRTMPYSPRAALPAAAIRPVVTLLEPVSDERRAGRDDLTWIGAIHGGYGNPLKMLRADAHVERVATRAFADGLATRGPAAPSAAEARHALAVTMRRFDANRFRDCAAIAGSSAVLTGRATGQAVWRDHRLATETSGGFFSVAFASVEELRAMNEAVDALLNNPELQAALIPPHL